MKEWNKCHEWNERIAVNEWNCAWTKEWDKCHEGNEIISVADQDVPQQVSGLHDVDGGYQSCSGVSHSGLASSFPTSFLADPLPKMDRREALVDS